MESWVDELELLVSAREGLYVVLFDVVCADLSSSDRDGGGRGVEVVIGIKSAAVNLGRRMRIRETWLSAFSREDWGGLRACAAFIVGRWCI